MSYQSGQLHKVNLRRACNKSLRHAMHLFADKSRAQCSWAATYYDTLRERGKSPDVPLIDFREGARHLRFEVLGAADLPQRHGAMRGRDSRERGEALRVERRIAELRRNFSTEHPLGEQAVEGRLFARCRSQKRDNRHGIAGGEMRSRRPERGGAARPARNRANIRESLEIRPRSGKFLQAVGGKACIPIEQWRGFAFCACDAARGPQCRIILSL